MQRFTFAVSIISTTIFWFLTAVPVHAQVVIVEFEGEINSVPDPIGLLPPSIQIGSPINGSYEIDVGLGAPVSPFPTWFGTLYFPTNGPSELTATVADVAYGGPSVGVEIGDDRLVTGVGVLDFWQTLNSSVPGSVFVLVNFEDSTLTRLDSENFFVNTSMDGWSGNNFLLIFNDGSTFPFLATGTLSYVPEPSISVMLASGIGALMMLRKMRR
jgi:hypothetical protein